MKILSYFKGNIGYFTPSKTKGQIVINYYNYQNLINPYEPKGTYEEVSYSVELTEDDILFIDSLYDKIEPMKKYDNDSVFLLCICILLISDIIKKPIFKILKLLEGI